jgi:hypothetical protein
MLSEPTAVDQPRARQLTRRTISLVAILVALAVVGATLYVTFVHRSSVTSSTVPNLQIDRFPNNGSASPQGDEPSVAVSPNGTIGIAWIRFNPIVPTLYFNQDSNFTTQIWYADSFDGGHSFSLPRLVSGGGTECVDPSVAFEPNETVLVSYLCTPSKNHTVFLAREYPTRPGFSNVTVAADLYLDRPWTAVTPDGYVDIAFANEYSIPLLTRAPESNLSFSSPFAFVDLQGEITSLSAAASGAIDVGIQTGMGVAFASWSGAVTPAPVTITVPVTTFGSLGTEVPVLSEPGPALARSSQTVFLTFVTDNDTNLVLRVSQDGGLSWGSNLTVDQSPTGPIEMPGVAVNPSGTSAVVTWRDGTSGHWNTFARAYSPSNASFSAIERISSSDGFPSSVRSWHGDFLGIASVNETQVCIAWSDGRGGISPDVGFGHIYAAIVAVNLG